MLVHMLSYSFESKIARVNAREYIVNGSVSNRAYFFLLLA